MCRGEDDRRALREAQDEVADRLDLDGVEPVRRLVEDEDVGLVHDRLREADALSVALRQRVDRRDEMLGEPGRPSGLRDGRFGAGGGHAAQLGHHEQVLLHEHLGVERRVLRQVSDLALDALTVARDVEPADRDRPGRRLDEARQHLHDGRLPGAVVPEEADDLSALDPKGNAVDGYDRVVLSADVIKRDHGACDWRGGAPSGSAVGVGVWRPSLASESRVGPCRSDHGSFRRLSAARHPPRAHLDTMKGAVRKTPERPPRFPSDASLRGASTPRGARRVR